MYIQKISIRNFRTFLWNFKGLNVIIGANNSGKTGLLYAIRLLNEPTLSVDDFNKNNLLKYTEQYIDDAPSIEIEYVVRHLISESDTEDEIWYSSAAVLGDGQAERTMSEKKEKITNMILQRAPKPFAFLIQRCLANIEMWLLMSLISTNI